MNGVHDGQKCLETGTSAEGEEASIGLRDRVVMQTSESGTPR